jgi:hypothetical protein
MKHLKLLLFSFLIILIFSGLAYYYLRPSINYLDKYLAKSDRADANVLLVEGWLTQDCIELASREFKNNGYKLIVTTGLDASEYFILSMDGYLLFRIPDSVKIANKANNHIIEISAYSELEGANCAHFNVLVNDSLIGAFFADKQKREYTVHWPGSLKDVDSILVQFDNDALGDWGDRNLYVKEITIDKTITIPYQWNSEYFIKVLNEKNRIENNGISLAENAKTELILMGVDSSLIIPVPGKKTSVNKTLTSALAFRDWQKEHKFEIKGLNIISVGSHSRRTWMTYRRILHMDNIGIIALPDQNNQYSFRKKALKTVRETVALAYYWIILGFY